MLAQAAHLAYHNVAKSARNRIENLGFFNLEPGRGESFADLGQAKVSGEVVRYPIQRNTHGSKVLSARQDQKLLPRTKSSGPQWKEHKLGTILRETGPCQQPY